MLLRLKQHVKNRRLVSLFELINRFNVDANIIKDMLSLLIRKGQIRQRDKTNHCGVKCVKCNPSMTEIYEWVEI